MFLPVLLILALVFTSIGITSVYADHPDPVELTFNQESYEFGDTMIIISKAPSPWVSTIDTCGSYISLDLDIADSVYTYDINATGHSTFIIPLNSSELIAGEFSASAKLTTISETVGHPGRCTATSHNLTQYYNSTLTSDHMSIVLRHMGDVNTLDEMNTGLRTALDDMYLHVDNIDITLNEIDSILARFDTAINDINSILTNINTKLSEFDSTFTKFDITINDLDTKLDIFDSTITTLNDTTTKQISNNQDSILQLQLDVEYLLSLLQESNVDVFTNTIEFDIFNGSGTLNCIMAPCD